MWKKSKANSTPNLPPGPNKLPVIGNVHNLVGDLPYHRLRDLSSKYGPIIHLQLGEITTVVISSPELAQEVMKTHDLNFAQRPFVLAGDIVSYKCTDIALAPYGEYWRQLRKMCSLELLTAKRVQSFKSIREEEVFKLVESISSRSGSPINFSKMASSLTYAIISRAVCGKVSRGEEVFVPAVEKLVEAGRSISLADLYPSIKLFNALSVVRRRVEKIHGEVDKIIETIVMEHRERKRMVDTGIKSREEEDLVDVLLKFQENGDLNSSLSNDSIKAVILDMFIAGSDASSTTIEWAMSEMVKNPSMEKAQAEVRKVFGSKGKVDEAGLHELNYLKLVIKETLRLHPALPLLLPRQSREDCVIEGYNIATKSTVIVNAWAIARDPKYWDEAERFYPERFINSSIDFKGTNFEFTPFGAGRRRCPGMLFGLASVELPLAQLLYHFDWKLPGGQKPEDLDMSDNPGGTATRRHALYLTATPNLPSAVGKI
ncbi:cytochrome P450 71D10 [Jatropha curcas]|uniref:CYP71D496 n=1 Tax=Jatropha curcas TaxID=180498 RepID=A0A191VYY3_JATCU|nr:cytochrome P450 71D10 [Jatropha curcas]ANJ20918.1 CYP71D496 [Jatropha curcas]